MTVRTGHDSSAFVGDLRCPPRANIRSGIARPCVRRPSCCACDPRAPIPWRSMSGDNYIKKRPELPHVKSGVDFTPEKIATRLQAALNGMPQGLCMFDADGRIVLFNQRYIELMALPANDLLGMSLLDLFHLRKAAGRFD